MASAGTPPRTYANTTHDGMVPQGPKMSRIMARAEASEEGQTLRTTMRNVDNTVVRSLTDQLNMIVLEGIDNNVPFNNNVPLNGRGRLDHAPQINNSTESIEDSFGYDDDENDDEPSLFESISQYYDASRE